MFPADGAAPDLQQLMRQAQQMQQQLMDAQAELAATQVRGSAGGGLVTATVTGTGELVGLVIAPAAVDPDDTETLADLVLAAVRDATGNAAALQEDSMGGIGDALGGGFPGLPGA